MTEIKAFTDKVVFNGLLEDEESLFGISEKCMGRLRKTNTKGVPVLIDYFLQHISFFAGLCLYVFMVTFMSRFVWRINLQEINYHKMGELSDALALSGIKKYALISDIDCEKAEHFVREKFDDIIWVSIEKKGCEIKVYIKEKLDTDIAKEDNNPYNIISNVDGKVESIITRRGKALVKAGDVITNGQVLVSGVIELTGDDGEVFDYRFVNGDADIYVSYEKEYYSEFYLEGDKADEQGIMAEKEHGRAFLENEIKEYVSYLNNRGIDVLNNGIEIYEEDNKIVARGKVLLLGKILNKQRINEAEYIDKLNVERTKNECD